MEVVAFVGLARNECAPQFIHSLTQRQCRPRGCRRDLRWPLPSRVLER